jgi:hypothetical protein
MQRMHTLLLLEFLLAVGVNTVPGRYTDCAPAARPSDGRAVTAPALAL